MDTIKYVVRFFLDDKYLYSVHCDIDSLDELLADARENGRNFKVVAYKSSSESEVSNG